MSKVYLLIGGNTGDRLFYLKEAIKFIEQSAGKVISASSVYETEAWGITDQPAFLNQVLLIETIHAAEDLLKLLLLTEEKIGRKRAEKYGPRAIDIDILFYDNHIIQKADLIVPHPEIQNRRFVLTPLNEIASSFVHPLLGKTIHELLEQCKDDLKVQIV